MATPALLEDPREALLVKLRLQAEMSQRHGQRVANLTQVDLRPHPAAPTDAASSAPNSSDSDTTSDEEDDEGPRSRRTKHRRSTKGGLYDGNRALLLHSELTARIRLAQAQSAKFANDSATSRMLPVEVVTLVPKPDAIQSLGTLTSMREGGGAMYEDILSFWGVWFVVAAVVRFQRPLRRKRIMDVQIRIAREKESVRLQLEQLKNAGLAHDTRRTARKLLQDNLHQSEAAAMRRRGATGRAGSIGTSPAVSIAPSPTRPPTNNGQQKPPFPQPPGKTVLFSSLRSAEPDSPLGPSPMGAAAPVGDVPSPRRMSFEAKHEQRTLLKTAEKIAKGTSYCGSLAKTITQHTHTADPTQLARFMSLSLQGPKPPVLSARGGGGGDFSYAGPHDRSFTERPRSTAASSSRSHTDDDALLKSSTRNHIAEIIPIPTLAARSLAARSAGMQSSTIDTPSSTVRLGSASVSNPFLDSRRGVWGPYDSSKRAGGQALGASASASTLQGGDASQAALHESFVKKFCDQQRRNGNAGVTGAHHAITLDERQFPYTPLPKLSAASARAYPPPTPRPPPSRGHARQGERRGAQTDVERTFMRRVDTNTFHEDMCHRLQHAEQWRQRDYDLKRQFLQFYSHKQPPGEHGTVHQLVRDMGQYVDAKRKQDARMERHALRMDWFHTFYEAMVERASWDELEPLLLAMEEQVMNAFSQLELEDFRKLFDMAQRLEILRLPSVQFFLCHVAAAYQVPYITYRELLELSHTPYVLQGNGESFYTTVEVK